MFEMSPITKLMLSSGLESSEELRKEISDVRYGTPGIILFDFRGKTYTTKEPMDLCVVGYTEGSFYGEKSNSWALKQLLSGKSKKETKK